MKTNYKTAMVLLAVTLALAGCSNGKKTSNSTSRSSSTNSIVDKGVTTGKDALAVAFKAYISARKAGAVDLIGEGGALGALCIDTTNPGTTNYLCGCQVNYTKQNGAIESYIQPADYAESNLLRCSLQIPSEVQTVEIRLYEIATKSTTPPFSLQVNRGNQGFDYSMAEAFLPVRKFQCHEHPSLPYAFDGNVYDPFESADPSLIYGMNFYSTNLGDSNYQHSSHNAALQNHVAWDCPHIPYNQQKPLSWQDQRLFSIGTDPAAAAPYGKTIADPSLGKESARSNFQLARAPGGIFTVPVNAFVAPQVGGTLGYGASPTAVSPGKESCPASAPPAGFRWVKVWLTRGELPARLALGRDPALMAMGSISCSPGKYANTTHWVFSDCKTIAIGLNSRVLATGMCVDLNPNEPNGLDFGFPQKTDVMLPISGSQGLVAPEKDSSCTGPGAAALDLLGVCKGARGTGADAIPANTPVEAPPTLVNLDQNGARYDYAFVVTPPTVMSEEMFNSSSSQHNQYIPYRYLFQGLCPCNPDAQGRCQMRDPDGSQGCVNNASQKITYTITKRDMLKPATDNTGSFPVCAIQPIEGNL